MIVLDLFSTILTIIAAFIIIGTVISIAIGYGLYLALKSLNENQRTILLAMIVLAGIVLMVTLIGVEIGTVLIFTAAFSQVFAIIGGQKEH